MKFWIVVLAVVLCCSVNPCAAQIVPGTGEWELNKDKTALTFTQTGNSMVAAMAVVYTDGSKIPVAIITATGWSSPCEGDGFDKCFKVKVDGKQKSVKILKSGPVGIGTMNYIDVKAEDIAFADEFRVMLISGVKSEEDLVSGKRVVGRETVIMDLSPAQFKKAYEDKVGKLNPPVFFGFVAPGKPASSSKPKEEAAKEEADVRKKEDERKKAEQAEKLRVEAEQQKIKQKALEDGWASGEKVEQFLAGVEVHRKEDKAKIDEWNKEQTASPKKYVDDCKTDNAVQQLKKARGNVKEAVLNACGHGAKDWF